MTHRLTQRTAYILLFTGAALVWAWEFAMARFGGRSPLVWTLIVLGTLLILASYAVFYSQKER